MAIKDWPGGVVSDSPVVPSGNTEVDTASGVWSLAQAADYTKQGIWPTAGVPGSYAILAGGISGYSGSVEGVVITTLGNSTDFGTLYEGVSNSPAAIGSQARYIYAGGYDGAANSNVIQYGSWHSTGTTQDFGDLTFARNSLYGLNNNTRGIFAGNNNVIEYVTIASTGNAIDFGDMTLSRSSARGVNSPTRGVFMSGSGTTVMDYITIASTGNATDFGDVPLATIQAGSCSSSTRGILGGGRTTTSVNTIEYITIASTGDSTDFGDILVATRYLDAGSSLTRGVFMGSDGGTTIQYITIASTGNATDFGNLTLARAQVAAATSNCHGGLS